MIPYDFTIISNIYEVVQTDDLKGRHNTSSSRWKDLFKNNCHFAYVMKVILKSDCEEYIMIISKENKNFYFCKRIPMNIDFVKKILDYTNRYTTKENFLKHFTQEEIKSLEYTDRGTFRTKISSLK